MMRTATMTALLIAALIGAGPVAAGLAGPPPPPATGGTTVTGPPPPPELARLAAWPSSRMAMMGVGHIVGRLYVENSVMWQGDSVAATLVLVWAEPRLVNGKLLMILVEPLRIDCVARTYHSLGNQWFDEQGRTANLWAGPGPSAKAPKESTPEADLVHSLCDHVSPVDHAETVADAIRMSRAQPYFGQPR